MISKRGSGRGEGVRILKANTYDHFSDTKNVPAFRTHPPHFPQKCCLVYICILVPLLFLDHPPHPRYFGLQDTKIIFSREGPTHQIFPQSIFQYHLHFSINCHFVTTHPPQWYFSIHGTKIKYRQKVPKSSYVPAFSILTPPGSGNFSNHLKKIFSSSPISLWPT